MIHTKKARIKILGSVAYWRFCRLNFEFELFLLFLKKKKDLKKKSVIVGIIKIKNVHYKV